MSRKETVWIDPAGGAYVLQLMTKQIVNDAGTKISSRANLIARSMSSNPPTFKVTTKVGVIRRGERAICTIQADGVTDRQMYIARMALTKAKDAGKV